GYQTLDYDGPDRGYDFFLELDRKPTHAVQVKFYKSRHPQTSHIAVAAKRLNEFARKNHVEKAILVVSCEISAELRAKLETTYQITLVDRADLLIMTGTNTGLHDSIRSMLEGDEYTGGTTKDSVVNKIKDSTAIITTYPAMVSLSPKREFCTELKSLSAGKKSWRRYEELCFDIIQELFSKDLSGWHKQTYTDDGLNRYDLICRITPLAQFWKFLIENINSRYVLFEFKNYVGKIKQGEVLTTEKYLLTKAMRSVAFLVSRKGPDKNGTLTIQGAMREHGKLMIPLCDDDLCKMLSLKHGGDDPSDYLFNLVDDFLMKLPR
ncbi:MAG: restriction endonuclease, partial [Gammaproteobacteria bacterium]|nr:restriction endonuclease [Gammaproteobacteria bacterium]